VNSGNRMIVYAMSASLMHSSTVWNCRPNIVLTTSAVVLENNNTCLTPGVARAAAIAFTLNTARSWPSVTSRAHAQTIIRRPAHARTPHHHIHVWHTHTHTHTPARNHTHARRCTHAHTHIGGRGARATTRPAAAETPTHLRSRCNNTDCTSASKGRAQGRHGVEVCM
jgi:hypothetical protein